MGSQQVSCSRIDIDRRFLQVLLERSGGRVGAEEDCDICMVERRAVGVKRPDQLHNQRHLRVRRLGGVQLDSVAAVAVRLGQRSESRGWGP